MQTAKALKRSRLKIIASVIVVILVVAALCIKFLVIDKLPISLTAILEMRRGAGEVGA